MRDKGERERRDQLAGAELTFSPFSDLDLFASPVRWLVI